jgi:antitoxin component YwqK of YwqJK toxin-antitoxin module
MDLYTVSLNGKATTYTQIKNVPFDIPENKLAELHKNSYISFFSKDGEIRIIFSQYNEEVYVNPKPLNQNCNTSIKEEVLEDNYGEYTLLKNLKKDLNLQEVRCYKDGFRQYIQDNGNIEWILNNQLHSPSNDIPAYITYYEDGSIRMEKYYLNKKYHRKNGPSYIEYYENGCIQNEYYFINGKYNREEGPSVIRYYDDASINYQNYYIKGHLHREEGPSIVKYNEEGSIKSEGYFINGIGHREDGPAYILYTENGSIQYEEYFINGKRHRRTGPAKIIYHENGSVQSESYYINGKRHREDGPAYIKYSQDGSIIYNSYYINGEYNYING